MKIQIKFSIHYQLFQAYQCKTSKYKLLHAAFASIAYIWKLKKKKKNHSVAESNQVAFE